MFGCLEPEYKENCNTEDEIPMAPAKGPGG